MPPKVRVGIEQLFIEDHASLLVGKKIGLITNHTAVNNKMQSTFEILQAHASQHGYSVTALFAPEHGIHGTAYAGKLIEDETGPNGIPIYSLHGKTHRPT